MIPAGSGKAFTSHALPVQEAENGRSRVPLFSYIPTAMHELAVEQSTLLNSLVVAPDGNGTVSNDQALPFHRSTIAVLTPLIME
jgi:hypothetical protein